MQEYLVRMRTLVWVAPVSTSCKNGGVSELCGRLIIGAYVRCTFLMRGKWGTPCYPISECLWWLASIICWCGSSGDSGTGKTGTGNPITSIYGSTWGQR